MAIDVKRTREFFIGAFFSRRIQAYPLCWYCGQSARKACLTCEDHSLREHSAGESLALALRGQGIDVAGLPHCYSCHCPFLTNTSTINVCDACLLQAITHDDDTFQD